MPKPIVGAGKPPIKSKQRSPPPLPPREAPAYPSSRSNSSQNTTPPSSVTPPSVYSASTAGTFMTSNMAAMTTSGSLLIPADSSASSSSGSNNGNRTRIGTGRNQTRSTSRSPALNDTSSSEGGYLMRTDSGNLFISPPKCSGDSPETMRTSVGAGNGPDMTTNQGFTSSLSHDSAVAMTNHTATTSSRTKNRKGSTKFQEHMFEDVPIRLANVQMSYDPSTGVTRPLLYHTDFRSYSAMLSKMTRRIQCCRKSWRCCALFLLFLLLLSFLGIAFLASHFFSPEVSNITGLLPNCPVQDPIFTNLTSGIPASRDASSVVNIDLSNKRDGGVQFYWKEPGFVGFEIVSGVSPYGIIGVYGRRYAPPSRFRHDFFKVIENSVLTAGVQSSSVVYHLENSTVGFVEFLQPGQWFVLFANDKGKTEVESEYEEVSIDSIGLNVFQHQPLGTGCPSDCSGNGFCGIDSSGKQSCQCKQEFFGSDCSMRK